MFVLDVRVQKTDFSEETLFWICFFFINMIKVNISAPSQVNKLSASFLMLICRGADISRLGTQVLFPAFLA